MLRALPIFLKMALSFVGFFWFHMDGVNDGNRMCAPTHFRVSGVGSQGWSCSVWSSLQCTEWQISLWVLQNLVHSWMLHFLLSRQKKSQCVTDIRDILWDSCSSAPLVPELDSSQEEGKK